MIRLKGELNWEITRFGIKAGDIIQEHTNPDKRGVVYFEVRYNGFKQDCVVWPANYEIVESGL